MKPAIIRRRRDITPLLAGAVLLVLGMCLGMLVAELQDEDARWCHDASRGWCRP